MNIRNKLAAIGAGTALVGASLVGAAPAQAVEYCSPSIGCVGQYNGQNIYAPSPSLTAKERNLMLQCNLLLTGALIGGVSRNWQSIGAAIFAGGAAAAGPCNEFWVSTARYR